jgi:tetratricopeptide (TPR) repeat protein
MNTSDTRSSTPGGSKRALSGCLVAVAVFLGLAGGALLWSWFQSLQNSAATMTAKDFVFEHPAVQKDLGSPIKLDGLVLGTISEGLDTGSAQLSFRVSGSQGSGRADVTLKMEAPNTETEYWFVTTAAYTGRDGVTRNLDRKAPSAPSTVAHARELYTSGENRAALEELNAVLEESPDHTEALYWRAQVHMKMGQEDSAREDILRAVALNTDLREAYLLHDYLLAKQHRWEEIITAWTQYLERHPGDAMALLERAGTYKHQGDLERAFKDLRRSCEGGNAQACSILQREKGG